MSHRVRDATTLLGVSMACPLVRDLRPVLLTGVALSVAVAACGTGDPHGLPPSTHTAAASGPSSSPVAPAASKSGDGAPPAAAPGGTPGTAQLRDEAPTIASAQPSSGEPPAPDDARVYAKTRFVWIRSTPDWGAEWIGYLWHGESVKLRAPGPVYGRGCGTWYAVLPRGYVCVDGKRATLDAKDPEYVEVKERLPHYESASPHRYAESMGAERYASLPDDYEQRVREPGLKAHLERVALARGGGKIDPTVAGIDLTPAGAEAVQFPSLPVQIQIPRRSLRRDSTVAYVEEYQHAGRSFLLTSDFAWVPKDRTHPYAPSTFHGVRLGDGIKLPIALFREHDRPGYRRREDGHFEQAPGGTFPRLGWVALTGRSEVHYPASYLETAKDDLWVLAADAVV
ncbi:MAG TPA: L,D-transpeptidase, partial [Polyangiaceae bacterium]